jgi:Amt family ammonium transporter
MFKLIDLAIGLRVSPEKEVEGLDSTEHGGNAYPDFGVSSYGGVDTVSGEPALGIGYGSRVVMVKKPLTQSSS